MENQRGDVVIILAGYKDRMAEFFNFNPGMCSRVAHHLDFPDFNLQELMDIAQMMRSRQSYHFDHEPEEAFRDYLVRRISLSAFANGRSVRNAIDRIKLRHANRLCEGSATA